MKMKNQATYDDANLILRLYELRRESKLRDARKWFGTIPPVRTREEWLALCPPGSEENAYWRMVTTYWDMAASFVAHGILSPELFYRSNNGEILYVWEKMKGVTAELRVTNKNPLLSKNIEDVVKGFVEYVNQHAPGSYEMLVANIAKIGKPASR